MSKEAQTIAYHALLGMRSMKYIYDDVIDGAIEAAAHRKGLDLTDDLRRESRGCVDKALDALGRMGRLDRARAAGEVSDGE
jgi:hypothetical protein